MAVATAAETAEKKKIRWAKNPPGGNRVKDRAERISSLIPLLKARLPARTLFPDNISINFHYYK